MYATGETLLERDEAGGVHLSYDGGVTWIQFRTEANYRDQQEQADRIEQSWDMPRLQPVPDEELDRWAEDRIEQDRAGVRTLAQSRAHHPTARVR